MQTPTPPLKALTLEELGNIEVITTRKQPESVWQTAAAIYVITDEDIRRSGATTLPDVLRLAPGVLVHQSDSNRWAVGVRGFADIFSKNVLVMIDGRSLYTPLVGGVHWAIQDLLLSDIERIEIIRGPGGSVWGANAVNGVINIITRSAADTQGARLTLASGTVEHGRASFRYGGRARGGTDYRAYAKWLTRGPQFHPDDANFDEWRSVQGGFRLDRRAGRNTWTVSGDVYTTKTGERAQVSFFTPPSTREVDGTLDLIGGNVIFRWERELARGSNARFQTYFDRTNRQGFNFDEARNTLDVDFNMRLAAWGRHQIAWGAGARFSPSTVTQRVPSLDFLPHERTHSLVSAFVQDDVSLVRERLLASIGVKFERNSYTGAEALPSARVLWTPRPRQALWGAVTRSIRTPSRFERDLQFSVLIDPTVPLYLGLVGSRDFESERVVGAELGYRTLVIPALYVDVTVFHNEYDDLAGLGNPTVGLVGTPVPHVLLSLPFANSVQASTSGVEISPEWRPAAAWQLKGSYSYMKLSASTEPGFTNTSFADKYRGLAPRHQVRVQSRLELPWSLEADAMYRFVDALPAQSIPRYHTVDARLGWRASEHVVLSLVGQSLLQPHHPEFRAVPVEIRRSAYVELVLTR